ncbi:hypothetical protein HYW54_04735 [Candidatus Gottesmanbacteria bacterium]|nr:hypothetical protein [Candidatus Gottesmanbacteria bacterium]
MDPQPTPTPKRTSPRILWIPFLLSLIIFISILIVIGIVIGKTFFSSQSNPTPTPTQIPILTPTPDLYTESDRSATANWKTYTNETYGFQFKYPDTLYIEPQQDTDNSVVLLDVVLLHNNYKERTNYLDQPNIQIDITKGNLKETIKNARQIEQESGNVILADLKPITIANYQGYRADVNNSNGTTTTVQIQKDDYIYGLMFVNVSKTVNQEDVSFMMQTFDQILSTFKFTEK